MAKKKFPKNEMYLIDCFECGESYVINRTLLSYEMEKHDGHTIWFKVNKKRIKKGGK